MIEKTKEGVEKGYEKANEVTANDDAAHAAKKPLKIKNALKK